MYILNFSERSTIVMKKEISNTTISDRIKEARIKAGYSQQQLAKLINVSKQAISSFERFPDRVPRNIKVLAEALGVTPQYLQYGSDDEIKEDFIKSLQAARIVKESQIPLLHYKDLEPLTTPATPLNIDDILTMVREHGNMYNIYLKEEEKKQKLAAFKVENVNAMRTDKETKRSLDEGDVVIINFDREPKNGSLVLAQTEQGILIREYSRDGNQVILIPFNERYETIKENFNIIGVVIKVIREFE